MIRLAVVSDTHWDIWDPTDPFAESMMKVLSSGRYDAIWHGGDVVHVSVLEALRAIAPVLCVKGNCDRGFGEDLPHSVRRQIEGVHIGMIHGWDLPLDHTKTVVERFPENTDVIIHGHTHKRRYEEYRADWGSCTVINPGSITSPRGGEDPGFGELVVNGPAWSYRRHILKL